MPKQVMRRSAADNEYLHKDFHGALSDGLQYLDRRFGPDAVREFLRRFTLAYYAPLRRDLKRRGLVALKEHFERLYATEGGSAHITLTEEELVVRVEACPAVTHLRAHGYPVARLFFETTRTVNEALCEGTDFAAELTHYDEQTGRSVQRFHGREGQ